MIKYKVFDKFNSSIESAREIEAWDPQEAAETYAEEDQDGNTDGLYAGENYWGMDNIERNGQPICVVEPDGNEHHFKVGIVEYNPVYQAVRDESLLNPAQIELQKALGRNLFNDILDLDVVDSLSNKRIEFMQAVVYRLQGSYPNDGVRKWFDKKRSGLKGRTPRDVLVEAWDPDSADAQEILGLAETVEDFVIE